VQLLLGAIRVSNPVPLPTAGHTARTPRRGPSRVLTHAERAADRYFVNFPLPRLPFDSSLAKSRVNQRVLPGFNRVPAAGKQSPSASAAAANVSAEASDDSDETVDDLPTNAQTELRTAVELKISALKSTPQMNAKEKAALRKKQDYRDAVVMRLAWLELLFLCRLIPCDVRAAYKTVIGYATVRYGHVNTPVSTSVSASAAAAYESATGTPYVSGSTLHGMMIGARTTTPAETYATLAETLSWDSLERSGIRPVPVSASVSAPASAPASAAAAASSSESTTDDSAIVWEDDDTMTVQGQRVPFAHITEQSQIDSMTDSEYAKYEEHAAKLSD